LFHLFLENIYNEYIFIFQWHAHDNLILVACWNPTNGLIVSGGEDCKYKVCNSLNYFSILSYILSILIETINYNL